LRKYASSCPELAEWIQSIKNHLWWSAETCGGDSEILIAKFVSIKEHITNNHSWSTPGPVQNCEHEQLSDDKIKTTPWMNKSTSQYKSFCNVVDKKSFLDDLRYAKHYIHTGVLESYHNRRLIWMPKRLYFTYDGMIVRSILCILDHNHNVERILKGHHVQYSKASKQYVVRNKYQKKNIEWRIALLQTINNYIYDKTTIVDPTEEYESM
jgi:hypothetical protein